MVTKHSAIIRQHRSPPHCSRVDNFRPRRGPAASLLRKTFENTALRVFSSEPKGISVKSRLNVCVKACKRAVDKRPIFLPGCHPVLCSRAFSKDVKKG